MASDGGREGDADEGRSAASTRGGGSATGTSGRDRKEREMNGQRGATEL